MIISESIRSFGLDALAGAVPLNIDLNVVLTVLTHTVCAAMRRRLPGYATTTPLSASFLAFGQSGRQFRVGRRGGLGGRRA